MSSQARLGLDILYAFCLISVHIMLYRSVYQVLTYSYTTVSVLSSMLTLYQLLCCTHLTLLSNVLSSLSLLHQRAMCTSLCTHYSTLTSLTVRSMLRSSNHASTRATHDRGLMSSATVAYSVPKCVMLCTLATVCCPGYHVTLHVSIPSLSCVLRVRAL